MLVMSGEKSIEITRYQQENRDLQKTITKLQEERDYYKELVEDYNATIKASNAEVKRLQAELQRLQELQEELEKIRNTTWEKVNEEIQAQPLGWDAEEMDNKLQEKFFIQTKVVVKEGVKYLFLRFHCAPKWWWVTWRGLLEPPFNPE